MSSTWLNEREASALTGFAVGTLRNWRVYGKGPKWIKLPQGSVRYRADDLELWMLSGVEAA